MTDAQERRYLALVAPIREAYLAEQYRLEAQAAAGIAHDLEGLHGLLSSSPSDYIEERWQSWLSRAIARSFELYQRECERIEREVVGTWPS